jgi:hypothetical protein
MTRETSIKINCSVYRRFVRLHADHALADPMLSLEYPQCRQRHVLPESRLLNHPTLQIPR